MAPTKVVTMNKKRQRKEEEGSNGRPDQFALKYH